MSAVAMACQPRQKMGMPPVQPLDDTHLETLDLRELARQALALLHTTGHVKTSEVELAVPAAPVPARVSRHWLEQVLFDLVGHAVVAQRDEAPGNRPVRLEVEPQDDFGDHGPSVRVRYAETAEPEAGLALVREQVEALGGRLGVKRHGRTGRTVTVELPDQGTASW